MYEGLSLNTDSDDKFCFSVLRNRIISWASAGSQTGAYKKTLVGISYQASIDDKSLCTDYKVNAVWILITTGRNAFRIQKLVEVFDRQDCQPVFGQIGMDWWHWESYASFMRFEHGRSKSGSPQIESLLRNRPFAEGCNLTAPDRQPRITA